ncbi:hypothetical protein CIB84_009103 [Bambusicola thoracicus]|uniref:Fibronectin type-III domain-containing protein n=1 Tax=Bambusicola thoracicus TaxID=9083 RepID=A0A2P4SSS1_BAMTH|nr:hypothetical protein CIB84_009103 [Bambusicola thoracicus]
MEPFLGCTGAALLLCFSYAGLRPVEAGATLRAAGRKAICSSVSHASDHGQTSRFLLPSRSPPLPALSPSPARSRSFVSLLADSPSAPVNVTVKHLKANSAVVTWDVLEDEVVIGFAISQQKKDVRMLRFIQEVNTTTRSCALWDLEEDTEYIVHVQAISIQGQSPASEPVLFKTPREAEKLASKNKGKCG